MLLLSASKYRIEITPSRYRLAFILLFELILLVYVWLWEPNWFPYQMAVQVLLSLLLLIHAVQACKTSLKSASVISLYQDGRWLYLAEPSVDYASFDAASLGSVSSDKSSPEEIIKTENKHDIGNKAGIQWRISPRSRFTDWLIWLHLSGNGKQHWFWVFRDEVPDADYRRICLAIRYSHQHGVAERA